jgi:hypothetical protein
MIYESKERRLYCTLAAPFGSVVSVDLNTNHSAILAGGFSRPRGILKVDTQTLLVVENEYRGSVGDPIWIRKVEGVGRLWRISTTTGIQTPVTQFRRGRISDDRLEKQFTSDPQEFWANEHQLLHWPTGIALHPGGVDAYVTEARRMCLVDLATGVIKKRNPVNLGFNVCGVRVRKDGSIVILDGGVADAEIGTGRLLIVNPLTGRATEVTRLPPFPSSIILSPSEGAVFVSFPRPFPTGTIIEFRLSDGLIRRSWSGLDRPRALALIRQDRSILAATDRGLIPLPLHR